MRQDIPLIYAFRSHGHALGSSLTKFNHLVELMPASHYACLLSCRNISTIVLPPITAALKTCSCTNSNLSRFAYPSHVCKGMNNQEISLLVPSRLFLSIASRSMYYAFPASPLTCLLSRESVHVLYSYAMWIQAHLLLLPNRVFAFPFSLISLFSIPICKPNLKA